MNFAPFWGATRHWENDKMDVVRVEDGEGLQRHKSGQISHCKQENRWTGWIWPIPGRGGGFDVPWGRYLPGHGPTQAKKWSCASFPKAPECLWTSAQGVLATYRQAGLSSSNNSACWAKQDGADEMCQKKERRPLFVARNRGRNLQVADATPARGWQALIQMQGTSLEHTWGGVGMETVVSGNAVSGKSGNAEETAQFFLGSFLRNGVFLGDETPFFCCKLWRCPNPAYYLWKPPKFSGHFKNFVQPEIFEPFWSPKNFVQIRFTYAQRSPMH